MIGKYPTKRDLIMYIYEERELSLSWKEFYGWVMDQWSFHWLYEHWFRHKCHGGYIPDVKGNRIEDFVICQGRYWEDMKLTSGVRQYDLKGNLIAEYMDTYEASDKTGYPRQGIRDTANGRQAKSRGYVWRYFG